MVTGLQIAQDRTSRHQTDLQLGTLSAVHELAGVHALGGDKQLLAELEFVRVTEVHDRQRSTTARIVDDVLQEGK